jgi:3-oxoacyl-[acyl-carrier protein] reductase
LASQGSELAGRVALVTGGGRGIGKAIALGLAADGADIALNYRKDDAAAAETVAEIERLGRRAIAYAAPVDDGAACTEMVGRVLADFGAVDILVNNAGIASRGQTVADTDPAELDRVWRTHAFAAWTCSKLVLPTMRTRPRGDIVMISSAATIHMGANSAPYNMAKAALEALAWTLAKEERRNGIHVNVVAPGLVDTEMGRRLVKGAMGVENIRTMDERSPFGHVCSPEEVADAVRFVVSERASYLTGQRLGVDGGAF